MWRKTIPAGWGDGRVGSGCASCAHAEEKKKESSIPVQMAPELKPGEGGRACTTLPPPPDARNDQAQADAKMHSKEKKRKELIRFGKCLLDGATVRREKIAGGGEASMCIATRVANGKNVTGGPQQAPRGARRRAGSKNKGGACTPGKGGLGKDSYWVPILRKKEACL